MKTESLGASDLPPRKRRRRVITFLAVAQLLGFLSSLDALMSVRTAQGTVAWMVSLNAAPVVAVPAYWIFGRTKFQGYVVGRRDEDSRLHHELEEMMSLVHPHRVALPPGERHVGAIERLAKMPIVGGNEVELLIDGQATFDSILQGIGQARDYVLVQYYIFRDDEVGRAFQQAMMAKAREGVRVFFLYDEIGSYQLSASFLAELAGAGVQVRRFHSTRGTGNRLQLNFRNHRKIVIVDGHTGWLGGLNVGDEYLGRDNRIGAWRDTHLRMFGPATLCLQLSFVEDWHWATDEVPELEWMPALADSNLPVLVLPSGPADRFETASLMVQHVIGSAHRRLWISSPYFVPDEGVISALKLAALRGVDVRILIPERPDNVLTHYAAYAFVGPLIEAGVSIHRYQAGFLHAKAFLVDDLATGISTVNLDNRSFRLNFEITAWVMDRDFAAQAEEMFHHDFAHARTMSLAELDEKRWWFRLFSRAAYLTAPVL
ncbi:cardiolipin synthase [Azoarcus taiwanensis]|uniref:Cardiolipin synthase n=1 Tax=Azoarcus taiwanensis TaxID=666964 RepID=A0A972F7X0_9RHOO|nr:cardiolipin synthase [Azoarcus taiwanensis]NMG03065.1 cardiolipin synthase [Azoarcus taiwanensis]